MTSVGSAKGWTGTVTHRRGAEGCAPPSHTSLQAGALRHPRRPHSSSLLSLCHPSRRQVSFLGHLSTPFPPAAFPYQQLLLSEASEKRLACSGCAPGNRKAGFYRGQGNAMEVSSNTHPPASLHAHLVPPMQETGKDAPKSHCCLDSPASQKPSPPFTDGGTSGALQMWPWHVLVWLCTGSKPGSQCCQQPPCTSTRRGQDTCPGVQPAMQKHRPSWLNAVTLPPAPSHISPPLAPACSSQALTAGS